MPCDTSHSLRRHIKAPSLTTDRLNGNDLDEVLCEQLEKLGVRVHVPGVGEQQHDLVRLVPLKAQRRDVRNEHLRRPAAREDTFELFIDRRSFVLERRLLIGPVIRRVVVDQRRVLDVGMNGGS
jgi:hypothetical protein